ncbi:heavy-metal-associated domain-containing protein [Pseudomonas sp. UBA2684]|uniref:heavy-metal-associated domain-containing protein n=1 Tax=Pseudomonas sp. UBA2684 TaxID=1947311 RepID=UPI0025DA5D90|nr:heavy metal-associated domain-containing protein [Pseudomonas sp. UBA2684]
MFALQVSGMGCGSCVSKITKAIQAVDETAKVEIDRAAGKVSVDSQQTVESICKVIQELGYSTQVNV